MCPNCPITGKQSFHGRAEALEQARFMGQLFRGRGLRPLTARTSATTAATGT